MLAFTSSLKMYGSSTLSATKRLLGTTIVTGANSGIGKATAKELARRGAQVILACRDVAAGEKVAAEINRETGGGTTKRASCRRLDLASLASVRQFADDIKKSAIQVDVLINNAGILPPRFCQTTIDGYEITFQTNFLGHFLLTNLLLENLRKSPQGGRVINAVAEPRIFHLCWPPYGFHFYEPKEPYSQIQAYIRPKLAITLATTTTMHQRMVKKEKAKLSFFSVNPGIMDPSKHEVTRGIKSPLFKTLLSVTPSFLFKSFEQGAETAVYCATQPGLEKYSGKFFQDCKVINPGARADDEITAERLFLLSEDMVKRYLSPAPMADNKK